MSKSKVIKDENVEMENLEDKNQEIPHNDIIVTDTALRSLYQLGFNSRSLTKTMVNSIKFDQVINHIKECIESEELSVRATAPLLLGLVRVYDKQIKLYLEDLMTIFNIQKGDQSNEANEKGKKSKKKILKDVSKMDSTQMETNNNVQSYLNNNILSMSPLQDGLFSMLNKDGKSTPHSKFLHTQINNLSPQSIEFFRAQQSGQQSSGIIDTKSKMNFLNSNLKSSNKIIPENSIMEEDQKDVNNFFQFISENVHDDDNHFDMPANINFDLNLNLNMTDSVNVAKHLIFNSDSKSFFNMEAFNKGNSNNGNLAAVTKNKITTKYEYDEEIEYEMDLENEAQVEESEILLEKFKSNFKLSQEDNLYNLLNLNYPASLNLMNFNNEDKKENFRDLTMDEPDERLINTFTNLDFKDFGFNEGEANLRDKLSKLFEEEKEEDKINFDDNLDGNLDENFVNNNDYPITEEINERNLEKFSGMVHSILKGKKKKTNFTVLNEKVKEDFKPHQTFYNLLCLAQKDSINITQSEIFNNESISINI